MSPRRPVRFCRWRRKPRSSDLMPPASTATWAETRTPMNLPISNSPMGTQKWLIKNLRAWEIRADVTKETGWVLWMETKTKILGLNAARLYGIDVEAQKKKIKAGGGY